MIFGAGSPMVMGGRFDMKSLEKDVSKASDDGCGFYVVPFPSDDYLSKMREFAHRVIPSYEAQTRLAP